MSREADQEMSDGSFARLSLEAALQLPMTGIVAIDCETTGLGDEARIIQFAAAFADLNGLFEGLYCTMVFGNGTTGSDETRSVHGLSERDLVGAPHFAEAVLPLFKVIDARTCFAHYAVFDEGRVNHEMDLLGVPHIGRVGCTKTLCEVAGYGRLRLQQAAKIFGIDSGVPHDAGDDSITALRVFLHLSQHHPLETGEYLQREGLIKMPDTQENN